jgi:hypothetical protein
VDGKAGGTSEELWFLVGSACWAQSSSSSIIIIIIIIIRPDGGL